MALCFPVASGNWEDVLNIEWLASQLYSIEFMTDISMGRKYPVWQDSNPGITKLSAIARIGYFGSKRIDELLKIRTTLRVILHQPIG